MKPARRNVPLTREQARNLDLALIPNVRNRLIAELVARDIPTPEQPAYLSDITGRALQTVARWVDANHPGLPDLGSLALLSLQLNLDANWLLGLLYHRQCCPYDRLTPRLKSAFDPSFDTSSDWVGALSLVIGSACTGKTGIMRGPEMAPLLRDGAPFFYDDGQPRIDCNGIYFLSYRGQTLVRHVERRIGEGLLLRCENPEYADTLLRDTTRAKANLTVIGRVLMAINVTAL